MRLRVERKLHKNNGLMIIYRHKISRKEIVHVLKYNILPCPYGHAILILSTQLTCTESAVTESSGSQIRKKIVPFLKILCTMVQLNHCTKAHVPENYAAAKVVSKDR